MTVDCPYCEYSGMVSAVEGHISGKSDEAHRGKVGRDLKDHLPAVEDDDVAPGTALVTATVALVLIVAASSRSGGEAR